MILLTAGQVGGSKWGRWTDTQAERGKRPVVARHFNLSLLVDGGKGEEVALPLMREAAQAAILQIQLAGGARVGTLFSYYSPRRPVSIIRSVPARIGEGEGGAHLALNRWIK